MSVLETFLISTLTTTVAFFFYILRLRVKEQSQTKAELELNKRQAFKKMLDEHSDIVSGAFHDKPLDEWSKDFGNMSKDILTWASYEVLSEYGKYAEKYYSVGSGNIIERELHFANAILAFRKELGYKNKKEKITPQQIVYIFRCGRSNKNI